jgi:hypothetical protein
MAPSALRRISDERTLRSVPARTAALRPSAASTRRIVRRRMRRSGPPAEAAQIVITTPSLSVVTSGVAVHRQRSESLPEAER